MGNFRVIIVGAGPAGLVLAHSLQRANIDYVLLERRDTVIGQGGAAIALMPFGSRIWHQLGLLETALDRGLELHSMQEIGEGGEVLHKRSLFVALKDNHGYPCVALTRPALLEILYTKLPEVEKKVLTGVRLSRVELNDEGVTAHLADGRVEHGSIIVGADGTHSSLRHILVEQDPSALSGQADFAKHSFKTLYGRSRLPEKFETYNGYMLQIHGPCWFMQIIPSGTYEGSEEVCWGIYAYEGEITQGRHRFTKEETADFVSKYAKEYLIKDGHVTIGDLWENRTFAKLDWMDEGISENWHHQRAVFVGDAAAKVTPSQAQGANSAMEASVALANELNDLISAKGNEPSTADIELAFSNYQNNRQMKLECMFGRNEKFNMLEGWTSSISRYIWHLANSLFDWRPHLPTDLFVAPWVSRSAKLDYVPFRNELQGVFPWQDPKTAQPPVGFLGGLPRFFWLLLGSRTLEC